MPHPATRTSPSAARPLFSPSPSLPPLPTLTTHTYAPAALKFHKAQVAPPAPDPMAHKVLDYSDRNHAVHVRSIDGLYVPKDLVRHLLRPEPGKQKAVLDLGMPVPLLGCCRKLTFHPNPPSSNKDPSGRRRWRQLGNRHGPRESQSFLLCAGVPVWLNGLPTWRRCLLGVPARPGKQAHRRRFYPSTH